MAAGGHARELQGDLDRVGSPGREQHLGWRPWPAREQLFGKCDGRLVGKPARRERQRLQLPLQGGQHFGMAMADVVDGIAVQIDDAPPVHVLEPYAFRRAERGYAWTRSFLVEEGSGVAFDEILGHSLAHWWLVEKRESGDLRGTERRRLTRLLRFSISQARPIAAIAKASSTRLLAAA